MNQTNMDTVGDIRRHHIGKESIRYDNVLRSFGELDRLASSLLHARPGPRLMPVDLYREADRDILTADLPGVESEKVKPRKIHVLSQHSTQE